MSMGALLDTAKATFAAFHYQRPLWLFAIPALWALCFWLARRRGQEGDWQAVIDANLLEGLRISAATPSAQVSVSPWPWLGVVWTLAAIALAGPVWRQDEAPAVRAPAAWVVVLDLSPSMVVTDVAPSRIGRARYALEDLLNAAHDARVGLVAFSDEAYTVTPLTEDVSTVRALLPPLSPDIMPSQGDTLAPGLAKAEELIAAQTAGERRIIVLTDGFQDPAAAFNLANRLHAQGVTVDVVGLGTADGAPLPDAKGAFSHDASGGTRMARLDEAVLRQLAAAGGGHYSRVADVTAWAQTLAQANPDARSLTPQNQTDAGATKDVRVAQWREDSVWLLPLIVLLAAGFARRGWVL